jgi:hypothetical protein
VKPHYILHLHWFDGKTPLWWVSRRGCLGITGGFTTAAGALKHAHMRTWIVEGPKA